MKRPISLLIIAILFIIGGGLAGWEIVHSLMHDRISPNLAVCLLFVGVGLLKLKASSRRWAIAWIVLGYILCAILLYGYFLFGHFNAVSVIVGENEIKGPLRFLLGSSLPLIFAMILIWMHRTLRRPDIVALFQETEIPDEADEEDHDESREESIKEE